MKKTTLFLKSHVDAFTRKDGVVVQAHETSVAAAAPRRPDEGEVGHYEHATYGIYFKKGDKVKDRNGKSHRVLHHQGADVMTETGEHFHPSKLSHVGVAPAAKSGEASAGSYVKPAHVKNKQDEFDHLCKIAPEKRTAEEKTRLNKIISQAGLGKHSPEYKAHLAAMEKAESTTPATSPKSKTAPALDPHPNVIGKATRGERHSFEFGGKKYHHTGKEGHSFHDQTPVKEAQSEDGHRVWRDGQDRVHADSLEEAKKARGRM